MIKGTTFLLLLVGASLFGAGVGDTSTREPERVKPKVKADLSRLVADQEKSFQKTGSYFSGKAWFQDTLGGIFTPSPGVAVRITSRPKYFNQQGWKASATYVASGTTCFVSVNMGRPDGTVTDGVPVCQK